MTICIYNCDYDDGIDNTAMAAKKIIKSFDTVIFNAKDSEFPGSSDHFDGFIITGSKKSLEDNLPWMEELRSAIRTRKPVLGICFGHQLIADMLGGNVSRITEGYNFGYEMITLKQQGVKHPIFKDIPSPLLTFSSHRFLVKAPPPGGVVIAEGRCGIQGFVKGNYIGLQFHPDISPSMALRLGENRNKDPLYPGDEKARESWEINKQILINFADIVKDSI